VVAPGSIPMEYQRLFAIMDHFISSSSFRASPSTSRICLRSATASLVKRPCLRAFLRRAGARCAAVHAAAPFALHRRRAARAAATGFGATARARQHRADTSDVIAHACASCLASAGSRRRPEPAALAAPIWRSSKTRLVSLGTPHQRNRLDQ
jgi:hypothetical protein